MIPDTTSARSIRSVVLCLEYALSGNAADAFEFLSEVAEALDRPVTAGGLMRRGSAMAV